MNEKDVEKETEKFLKEKRFKSPIKYKTDGVEIDSGEEYDAGEPKKKKKDKVVVIEKKKKK